MAVSIPNQETKVDINSTLADETSDDEIMSSTSAANMTPKSNGIIYHKKGLMKHTKLRDEEEDSGVNPINNSLNPINDNEKNIHRPLDENPEIFYSDYSTPRTRSPSHN